MSDLERRSGSRPSRRQREQRAYRLVLATSTFTVLFVAAVVLTLITSFSGSWAVLFAVLAVLSGFMLRRALRP
jgi:uncharacterized membrane protein